jgi:hypothetical protein
LINRGERLVDDPLFEQVLSVAGRRVRDSDDSATRGRRQNQMIDSGENDSDDVNDDADSMVIESMKDDDDGTSESQSVRSSGMGAGAVTSDDEEGGQASEANESEAGNTSGNDIDDSEVETTEIETTEVETTEPDIHIPSDPLSDHRANEHPLTSPSHPLTSPSRHMPLTLHAHLQILKSVIENFLHSDTDTDDGENGDHNGNSGTLKPLILLLARRSGTDIM